RHYFDKYGGNMGQSGSVMFMFSRQGVILIEKEDVDEDKLMEDALEAGAVDFLTDGDVYDVRTEVNDLTAVGEDLQAKGYELASIQAEYVPSTYTRIDDPDAIVSMGKMLEMFEDNDDVQAVWHNWENEDDYEG
ncbi:MAG: YebC/PmpR family DNA-binding transcriptional regulator, partial [Clostridia bacterium]|nr:YebC/PmpR family DNA-binding transcriptional regulator [Clostridia bacterium]